MRVKVQLEPYTRFCIVLKRTLGVPQVCVQRHTADLLFAPQLHGKEISLLKISLGKQDQCPSSQNLCPRHKLL